MKVRQQQNLLLPERLFSPAVFLVSLAWMSMMHLLDFENNLNIAPIYQRVIVLILIHFIPFLLPAVVFVALRNRLSAAHLVLGLSLAVVVGAALRGLAQFYILNFISSRPLSGVSFRVAASATNTTFAILIAWAGFSAAEFHKRRRQRLLEDREQLLLLRHHAREQIDRIDSGAAEEIRAALLSTIQLQTGERSGQIIRALHGLIEDVVRPLSQYFEQQSNDWMPPEPPKRMLRIDWRSVLGRAFQTQNIYVAPLVAMFMWTSLPNTYFNRGALIAAVSMLHVLMCFPMFALIKHVGARVSTGRSVAQKALIFFFGLYVGGQTLGLTSWIYTRFQEPHFFYAVIGPFYAIVGGGLIAFATAAVAESEAMEETLETIGSALRWSLARARETHRQQRRALAHALHGQIQAAIASAILRIELSNKGDQDGHELAQDIVDSLKTFIANVNLLSNQNVPLEVVLERIGATWDGIARVRVQADAGIEKRLALDSICAVALNDVLTELMYNSIKHGSASEVLIQLDGSQDRILKVSVLDNGRKWEGEGRRGLGSALLDDCAISWRRSREGGQTITEVELPMLDSESNSETDLVSRAVV